MSAASAPPSLMDDVEFLGALEELGRQGPGGSGAGQARHARHHRHAERLPGEPDGAGAVQVPLAVSVLTILTCAAVGAGAAAFVFHDRLAQMLH